MGRRLIALGHEDDGMEIAAALESAECPLLGQDAGNVAGVGPIGVSLSAELTTEVDTVIDFSVPEGAARIVRVCRDKKLPLVMATTALDESTQQQLQDAAAEIPVVWAPNMSLAVNLTMKLSQIAGEALKESPSGCDVEIIERHHRYKEDAPSGTALKFGQLIAEVMGQKQHTHGREGITGKRPADEIGYHAVRTGDNPGEHTIVFGLLGETIELRVAATGRDCYAQGALAAARFAAGKEPGLYNMFDVLGL